MNEQLEKIFKNIKRDMESKGYDYQKIVDNGNIFIPHILLLNKEININEKMYISLYFLYKRDIRKVDEMMLKTINKNTLKRIKKHLSRLSYIKETMLDPKEAKEKTIKLSHKGKKCDWCGKECYILHQHHYPIPQKDGGKETVNICPNCHSTYHSLIDTKTYE